MAAIRSRPLPQILYDRHFGVRETQLTGKEDAVEDGRLRHLHVANHPTAGITGGSIPDHLQHAQLRGGASGWNGFLFKLPGLGQRQGQPCLQMNSRPRSLRLRGQK